MPQQFLNKSDVVSRVVDVSSEGRSQVMTADGSLQASTNPQIRDELTSESILELNDSVTFQPCNGQWDLDVIPGKRRHWDDALLVSLASNGTGPLGDVIPRWGGCERLTDAHPHESTLRYECFVLLLVGDFEELVHVFNATGEGMWHCL